MTTGVTADSTEQSHEMRQCAEQRLMLKESLGEEKVTVQYLLDEIEHLSDISGNSETLDRFGKANLQRLMTDLYLQKTTAETFVKKMEYRLSFLNEHRCKGL